jgi:uroporphyrin-III C-methyltransferase/precorrin-2 dehydrogenase/sirohydrochlorin ferrochelatase
MGRAVAARVASRLAEAGLAPSTPVAVIENASRREARTFAGRLDELARIAAGTDPEAPVLIIIGDVVAAGALAGAPASLAEIAA